MLSPDEIIDAGFVALKTARPSLTAADLADRARRCAIKSRIKKSAISLVGSLAVVCFFLVGMKPTSALAALSEAARLSAEKPVAHIHIVNEDFSSDPASRPAPHTPAFDIWKFRDRYLRKQKHGLTEQFKSGRILTYDDRFPYGFELSYNSQSDHFWSFDGSIGVEIIRRSGLTPSVKNVHAHGGEFTVYEWLFTRSTQTKTAERIYVDPKSKLIRYAEGERHEPNGDSNHGWVDIDYPDAKTAEHGAPHFPQSLKFRTKNDLIGAFYRAMAHPEQGKKVGGIRISLYGVIVYPGSSDGLKIEAVTRRGAKPDIGSGHEQMIHGVKYLRNNCSEFVGRVPTRITVRVPIWRSSSATIEKDGKPVHSHEIVGYATFTTSRIFCCPNGSDLNYYDIGSYRHK